MYDPEQREKKINQFVPELAQIITLLEKNIYTAIINILCVSESRGE